MGLERDHRHVGFLETQYKHRYLYTYEYSSLYIHTRMVVFLRLVSPVVPNFLIRYSGRPVSLLPEGRRSELVELFVWQIHR
jgi:hypothetical protein